MHNRRCLWMLAAPGRALACGSACATSIRQQSSIDIACSSQHTQMSNCFQNILPCLLPYCGRRRFLHSSRISSIDSDERSSSESSAVTSSSSSSSAPSLSEPSPPAGRAPRCCCLYFLSLEMRSAKEAKRFSAMLLVLGPIYNNSFAFAGTEMHVRPEHA